MYVSLGVYDKSKETIKKNNYVPMYQKNASHDQKLGFNSKIEDFNSKKDNFHK